MSSAPFRKLLWDVESRLQRLGDFLPKPPPHSDGLVSLPGNKVNFTTIDKRDWVLTGLLDGSNKKMNMDTHGAVVMNHSPMPGLLHCPVLTLPTELLIGEKSVGVSMLRIHVVFRKGNK